MRKKLLIAVAAMVAIAGAEVKAQYKAATQKQKVVVVTQLDQANAKTYQFDVENIIIFKGTTAAAIVNADECPVRIARGKSSKLKNKKAANVKKVLFNATSSASYVAAQQKLFGKTKKAVTGKPVPTIYIDPLWQAKTGKYPAVVGVSQSGKDNRISPLLLPLAGEIENCDIVQVGNYLIIQAYQVNANVQPPMFELLSGSSEYHSLDITKGLDKGKTSGDAFNYYAKVTSGTAPNVHVAEESGWQLTKSNPGLSFKKLPSALKKKVKGVPVWDISKAATMDEAVTETMEALNAGKEGSTWSETL